MKTNGRRGASLAYSCLYTITYIIYGETENAVYLH